MPRTRGQKAKTETGGTPQRNDSQEEEDPVQEIKPRQPRVRKSVTNSEKLTKRHLEDEVAEGQQNASAAVPAESESSTTENSATICETASENCVAQTLPLPRSTAKKSIKTRININLGIVNEHLPSVKTDEIAEQESSTTESEVEEICKIIVRDLSKGKERYPVRLVNGVDEAVIPSFGYITNREMSFEVQKLVEMDRKTKRTEPCCTNETCGKHCKEGVCPCRTYSGAEITYWRHLLMYHHIETYDNSAMPIKECSSTCCCHKDQSSCHNRVVSKGAKIAVDVFRTEYRGWGVRSRTPIKEGEYVGEYVGVLRKDTSCDRIGGDYIHGIGEEIHGYAIAVDACQKGNYTRFINHSCEPNVFVAKVARESVTPGLLHLCFFALVDLKAYEELLIDYGSEFWESKGTMNVFCRCGTASCRHSVELSADKKVSENLLVAPEKGAGPVLSAAVDDFW